MLMTAGKESTVKTVEEIWDENRYCSSCGWCHREATVSEYWGAPGVIYETFCVVLEDGLDSDTCPDYAAQEIEEDDDEALA